MSIACESVEGKFPLPILDGFVGDDRLTVLRDTGCSLVVVKTDLVERKQFTEKTQKCVLINGTVREALIALIGVHTPYFIGNMKALFPSTSL